MHNTIYENQILAKSHFLFVVYLEALVWLRREPCLSANSKKI